VDQIVDCRDMLNYSTNIELVFLSLTSVEQIAVTPDDSGLFLMPIIDTQIPFHHISNVFQLFIKKRF